MRVRERERGGGRGGGTVASAKKVAYLFTAFVNLLNDIHQCRQLERLVHESVHAYCEMVG